MLHVVVKHTHDVRTSITGAAVLNNSMRCHCMYVYTQQMAAVMYKTGLVKQLGGLHTHLTSAILAQPEGADTVQTSLIWSRVLRYVPTTTMYSYSVVSDVRTSCYSQMPCHTS
jgi:hypothetical protein